MYVFHPGFITMQQNNEHKYGFIFCFFFRDMF